MIDGASRRETARLVLTWRDEWLRAVTRPHWEVASSPVA